MHKLTITIIVLIIVMMTEFLSFYCGFTVGHKKIDSQTTSLLRQQIQEDTIKKLTDNPPSTFSRESPNILTGLILEIKSDSLRVLLQPRNIEDAVRNPNREVTLKISKDTQIYTNNTIDNEGNSTATKNLLSLNNLHVGETLLSEINPEDFEKNTILAQSIVVGPR